MECGWRAVQDGHVLSRHRGRIDRQEIRIENEISVSLRVGVNIYEMTTTANATVTQSAKVPIERYGLIQAVHHNQVYHEPLPLFKHI